MDVFSQWAHLGLEWIGFGTLVGLLAKAIMPGRDPGGAIVTLLMGIGGAVIDVWYNYPTVEDRNPSPMNFPFRDLENTILSPHNSGWTQEQIDRRWRFVCANLDRLARGEELQNIV